MTKFLTTLQAAEILGIKRNSVVMAIRLEVLKAEKFGRDYRLKIKDINAYKKVRRNINRKDCKKKLTTVVK